MKDYLITGGKLVDGTGAPWRYADVLVSNGKIIDIGSNLQVTLDAVEIDAAGMVVCPGFIDTHSHADIALLAGRKMDGRLLQGITTEVVGQDGISYAPASGEHLDEWRRYLAGLNGDFSEQVSWDWSSTRELIQLYEGCASNVVHLTPHGAIRVEVIGWEARHASSAELKQMQALMRQSLEEGAAGISTGLTYIPCTHATTEEMIALCKPVGDYGGILSIHLRSYAGKLLEAIEEAILIGKESGAGILISHLRMADVSTWGLADRVLELIEKGRADGVDISADMYPYTVGCAPLFALLPPWAQFGGPDAILERLSDQPAIKKIAQELDGWEIEWGNYILSNCPPNSLGDWEGKPLTEAAERLGLDVTIFIPMILRETKLQASIVAAGGNEAANQIMFKHYTSMVGSDGILIGGHPHPRAYGTYPRVFAEYVRENQVLRLEEAIHKMTGMPAARLNLQDRGILKIGCAADVVVFSLDAIQDNADYEDGSRLADGVCWVLVNGEPAVANGFYQGGSSGRALTPLLAETRRMKNA
jgi:N-acyl-D-amino-acid deacylase